MTGKQKYLNVKYLCLFFLLKADDKILDQHLIPYRHNTTAPAPGRLTAARYLLSIARSIFLPAEVQKYFQRLTKIINE